MRSAAIKNGNYHVIIGAHCDEKPALNYNPELDAWVDSMISKKPVKITMGRFQNNTTMMGNKKIPGTWFIQLYYPDAVILVDYVPAVKYENMESWSFRCRDVNGNDKDITFSGWMNRTGCGIDRTCMGFESKDVTLQDTTYEKIKAICREVVR